MPGIDLRSSGLAASVFIYGAISLAHRGLCRELLSTFCLLLPSHHEVSKQSFLLHTAHHVILLLHRSKPKEPANHWAEVYEMEPHQSFFPISCMYLLQFVSDKKLTNTDFVLFCFPKKFHAHTTLRNSLVPAIHLWSPVSHSLLCS